MVRADAVITKKVARAIALMKGGMSLSAAAREAGLKRSTLQSRIVRSKGDASKTQGDASGSTTGGSSQSQSRGSDGRFLPGSSGNPGGQSSEVREARKIFEQATPTVAKSLVEKFKTMSSSDDPELYLAYAKEILDRGLGKPKQAVEVSTDDGFDEDYQQLQETILSDPEALRLAVALSDRLDGHAGDHGAAPDEGQVQSSEASSRAIDNSDPGSDGDLSETDNLDAPTSRQESDV